MNNLSAQQDQEVEKAIKALPSPEFDTVIPLIRQMLCANLENDRLRRFYKGKELFNLTEYAYLMAQTMQTSYEVINRIETNDEGEWEKLSRYHFHLAYSKLIASGIGHHEARQRADDFAQQMYIHLIAKSRHFPGDVPYIAWRTKVAKHEFIRMYSRGGDVLDKSKKVISLEEDDGEESPLIAGLVERDFTDKTDRILTVKKAIEKIPVKAQRRVLEMLLDGYTESEMAVVLHKSLQAIYNLRHRAIREANMILRGWGEAPMTRS